MTRHTLSVIDDRTTGDLNASAGNTWRLVTDDVMGGVSRGKLEIDQQEQRACLRMQGKVKLDNNGGFIQMSLPLSEDLLTDISAYTGFMLEVYGNDQAYNMHLRSRDTGLPWQSYRTSFTAMTSWQTVYLPFSDFKSYRIDVPLDISRLTRLGLVAIGREFDADLCLGKIGLYR